MVTQAQVQNADPVYQKVLAVNATIVAINAAVPVGYTGPITLYIGGGPGGNSVQIDLSAIGVSTVLNSMFTQANSTLTTLNSQLAAI
jgi:opacity protein-like surface antigen